MTEALAEREALCTANTSRKITPFALSPATREPKSSLTSFPSLRHCSTVLIDYTTAINDYSPI